MVGRRGRRHGRGVGQGTGRQDLHPDRLAGSHRGSKKGRKNEKSQKPSPAKSRYQDCGSERGGGEVKIEWIKARMGILGNEAADVLANKLRGAGSRGRREVDVWGRDTVLLRVFKVAE